MNKTCKDCRWVRCVGDTPDDTTRYFCHRYPPKAGEDRPRVAADDFCGEWEDRGVVTARSVLEKIWSTRSH